MSDRLKLYNRPAPIISICTPTFNRAALLAKFFQNLEKIKKIHGNLVEICISNNQSTDNTASIIEQWRSKLDIKVITQTKNIGATMNGIAVTQIATGKWMILIGDDDALIVENFTKLLEFLLSCNDTDWVLSGVADCSGKESLLGSLKAGHYSSNCFKKIILRDGVYRYGFIGMHIIPSSLQKEFSQLTPEQAQPWPHLALFLRHVQSGSVQVHPTPVVQQAGGGAALFWSIIGVAHIKLRKLNVIFETKIALKSVDYFFDWLMIRELYLARDIRTLLFWKVFESNDFNSRAFFEYFSRYKLISFPVVFLSIFHCVFLLLVIATPAQILKNVLILIGQKVAMDKYNNNKKLLESFDGIKRGV